jgi:hypothetical protein
MLTPPTLAAVLTALAIVPLSGHAETPTDADFRACNIAAAEAVKNGTATPTTKDQTRAETARRAKATVPSSDSRGMDISGPTDPQLVGTAPEGVTDAVYHAAYRTCMRRSGF